MAEELLLDGRLVWDETGQPIEGATVQVCTADGTPIATAKSDGAGQYKVTFSPHNPMHILVSDAAGHVIHSTRDAAMMLEGTACHIDSIVPEDAERAEAKFAGVKDLAALAREAANPEDLLDIARALVSPERARMAADAIVPVRKSLCGTPVLVAIEETIRAKGWPRDTAYQVDNILGMGDSAFTTATYTSAHFTVTYQTSGPGAPPMSTASEQVLDPGPPPAKVLATIGDGVTPTYILRVVFWLERALAAYTSPPFSMKNPAAAGRIPVVINTAPYGSASPSGTFYLNNMLAADLICAVGVHELFHMVQFQYGWATGPWKPSVMEGGAVFAEDSAADRMNRYLDEAGSNFNGIGTQANPNLSLMTASYKCGLFWRYVAEQQSGDITEPFVGVETFRNVMEHCSSGTYSTADLKAALRELPWYQDFYEFSYLDPAKLDRTNSETVLGNYALACYLKDLGVNVPDSRFDFIEDEENIYIDQVVGGPASTTLVPPALSGKGTLNTTGSVAFTGSVNAFAHRYYEVAINAGVTNVQVNFMAGAGLTNCLFQLALIDQAGAVRDIIRTDRTAFSKRVTNLLAGRRLSKVLAVVTGTTSGGSFSISMTPAAPAPDVMITRWHSRLGREYEINSRNWAWTWVSPDVWVDNNGDGVADGTVFFKYNNKLHLRLHNKGNLLATGIRIEAFYQDASVGLSSTAWKPVKNLAGVTQVLSGLSLAPGATKDWVVDWSPVPSGASQHFCLRAVVTAPGDPNTDNKRCVSNFGCVKVKVKQTVEIKGILEQIRQKFPHASVQVIPRLGTRRDIVLPPRDIKDLLSGKLEAISTLRISHVPAELARETPAIPESRLPVPDAARSYNTEQDALPPGVAGKPMVTITAVSDGVVQGGVTLMIEVED